MAIIRRRTIEQDDWRHLPEPDQDAGSADVPADGRVVVPLRVLLEQPDLFSRRGAPIGVRLGPDDGLHRLEPFLPDLALIAIEFPVFTEGRGFSQARLLRERYGFQGEIRAVGEVTRDRLAFLERCGFDAFELRTGESVDDALAAFSEVSLVYQPAAVKDQTISSCRAAQGI